MSPVSLVDLVKKGHSLGPNISDSISSGIRGALPIPSQPVLRASAGVATVWVTWVVYSSIRKQRAMVKIEKKVEEMADAVTTEENEPDPRSERRKNRRERQRSKP